jgi:hypothetical protein
MFGLDPDVGNSALRLWVAAGSAALLVFVCALAFDWTRTRTVARVSVVVVGAILGGTLAWAFLNAAGSRDRAAERRDLENRAAELNVRALQPGSPLACLDGLSGDGVEAACERALFASPVSVATATTYVAARLALLADMTTYVQRGGGNIDTALVPLRRGLETDRFGFVAHTLATRDLCSSDKCKALLLLSDPSRVRANLSGQTLDRYLDRYLTVWAQAPGVPVADAAPITGTMPPALAQAGDPNAPKKTVNIDFPSADSIPAVSIMNPEPKGPVTPQSAAAAVNAGQLSSAKVVGPMTMPPMPGQPGAEKQKAADNAKGKRKQAGNPPAQAAPQTTAAAPQAADPVWSPGATLASPHPAPSPGPSPAPSPPAAAAPAAAAPAAAAPAASAGGGGVPLAGMPVQITPFAPQGGAAQ